MNIKDEILSNTFVETLRLNLSVDDAAYSRLLISLRALESEWKGQALIDKGLMQEIYVIPAVIKGAAERLRLRSPELALKLDDMAIEVDGLIIDSLS